MGTHTLNYHHLGAVEWVGGWINTSNQTTTVLRWIHRSTCRSALVVKMMKEASAKLQKRELKECIRMTSVSCTSEPQVGPIIIIVVLINSSSSYFQANAALALELGDLTTFTDLINTKDVESGSKEARHWINSATGEARGSLVEMAINKGRTDFLDVLLRAGAR